MQCRSARVIPLGSVSNGRLYWIFFFALYHILLFVSHIGCWMDAPQLSPLKILSAFFFLLLHNFPPPPRPGSRFYDFLSGPCFSICNGPQRFLFLICFLWYGGRCVVFLGSFSCSPKGKCCNRIHVYDRLRFFYYTTQGDECLCF